MNAPKEGDDYQTRDRRRIGESHSLLKAPTQPKSTVVRNAPEAIPRTCCDARAQADDSASREAANGMLCAEKAPALLNNLPALAREAMAASLCTTPALTSNVHPNPLNYSDVR